jgi:predicted nucleotidyltransferase
MRRGSEAQGTFVASTDPNSIDDRDIMGVCMLPLDQYLGLKSHGSWESADEIHGVWDVVLYEFRKFVGLLLKSNPNVIGMLWLDKEDYLKVSPAGQLLIDNRKLFINKTALYDSFTKYAASELRSMTGNKEFKGYMGKKRKELVEKFGYDVKDASHLCRLLTMAKEFLVTGELQVKRTQDRQMFIDIKTGKWTLERVQMHAEYLFKECEAAFAKSTLPDEVDDVAIHKLVVRALRLHHGI